MALIPCPECKREVSDRAATCPSCGFAIAARAAAGPATGSPPVATHAPAFLGSALASASASPSGPTDEAISWEGHPSARLMAREVPGVLWALVTPIFAVFLLPDAMKVVGGLNDEFKKVIAQQGGTLR